MTKYSKFTLLALVMALALFSVAGPSQAALETAGSLVINMDAESLSLGAFTTWSNTGTGGGTFAPDPTCPEPGNFSVVNITRGQSGLAKKAVAIDNKVGGVESSNRRPCNALVWSKQTQDLFAGVASSFSLEIWVYNELYMDYEALASFGPRDLGTWISFWQGKPDPAAGDSRLIYGAFGGITSDGAIPTRQLAAGGTFNLFTFVYDKDTGITKCYVNGKLFKQSANVAPSAVVSPNWYVHLGGYGRQSVTNAAAGLTGAIPKARVHTGALSAAQVLNNFDFERPDYITNSAPQFVDASATRSSVAGAYFGYTPPLTSVAFPYPTFSLVGAPAGMVIDSATGAITWAPAGAVGSYPFTVNVSNSAGSDSLPVTVNLVARSSSAIPGDVVELDATLLADGPVTSWENIGLSGGSMLPGNGNAPVRSTAVNGAYTIPQVTYTGDAPRTTQYWTVQPLPTSVTDGTWTMEAWAEPEAAFNGTWTSIIGIGNAQAGKYAEIAGQGANWGLRTSGGNDWVTADPLNQWYHLVATYNGATLRFYVNGVAVSSSARTISIADASTSGGSRFRISGMVWNSNSSPDGWNNFTGKLSRVRVHGRALAMGQVRVNFNAEAATYLPSFTPFTFEAPIINDASVPASVSVRVGANLTWGPAALTNDDNVGIRTWSVTGAPAGLAINTESGVITWTGATPVGTYPFTVTITTPQGTDSVPFTVVVQDYAKPVIDKVLTPTFYKTTLAVALAIPAPVMSEPGWLAPTWTLDATSLARGMTINAATGAIAWANPTPIGSYPVVATVTNAQGSDTLNLTVKVVVAVSSVPPTPGDLFFSVDSTTIPAAAGAAVGNWQLQYRDGVNVSANPAQFLTPINTPTVEAISGAKWTKIERSAERGFELVDANAVPISPMNGGTIVAVVKPKRTTSDDAFINVVSVFFNGTQKCMTLGVRNATGQVEVWRNGFDPFYTGMFIPDAQSTILSFVIQPTGEFKVYANGAEGYSETSTSDFTSPLDPTGNEWYQRQVHVGRGFDGWSTFNGNVGDVLVYKTALSDVDRATLETNLRAKFAMDDPALGLSTNAIDFGKMKPGSSTPAQTVTITNVGQGDLTFNAIEKRGTNAADFVMTPDPASVAPLLSGQSRTFTVAFAPQLAGGTGAKTASIVFGAATGPVTLNLSGISGYGELGLLRPVTTLMELGDPDVGVTGPFSDVRMRNTGADNVTFKSIATTGDFVTNPADLTAFPALPPGEMSWFQVAAHPTASGMRTGTLVITYDPGDGVDVTITISLVAKTTNRWYVATTGNDANAGTDPGLPKLTVNAAFLAARPTEGSVIEIQSGTYTDSINFRGDVNGVRLVGKGATKPVISEARWAIRGTAVQPTGGEDTVVTIENIAFTRTGAYNNNMVQFNEATRGNITIRGCDFDMSLAPGSLAIANWWWVAAGTCDTVVESCTFTDTSKARNLNEFANFAGYLGIRDCTFTGGVNQVIVQDHTSSWLLAEIKDCDFADSAERAVTTWNSPGSDIRVTDCTMTTGWGVGFFNSTATGTVTGLTCDGTGGGWGIGAITMVANDTVWTVSNSTFNNAPAHPLFSEGNGNVYNVSNVVIDGGPEGWNGSYSGDCTYNLTDLTVKNTTGQGLVLWGGLGRNVYNLLRVIVHDNNGVDGGVYFASLDFPSTMNVTECTFVNNGPNAFRLGNWANDNLHWNVVIDRSRFSVPAGANGIWLEKAIDAKITNSVFEGGLNAIQLADIPTAGGVFEVDNCTMIGTEATADPAGAAVFGSANCIAKVRNTIALGYATLDGGVAWDAASSNNIAFIQGDAGLVDPKLAFQGGAAFARPADVSPLSPLRDYLLTAASTAARGQGLYLGDPLAVDYNDSFRPNPPSIGAFEGPNAAPLIVAIPDATAGYGLPFTLTPVLSAGYPSPVWTLDAGSLARGLTIDAETGVISWASAAPLGTNTVTVTATNGSGADSKSFALTVQSTPPVIQPFDPDTYRALAGVAWESPVPVLLAGTPAPVWTLDLEPNPSTAAITIDPATGQVSWADPIAGVDAIVTVVATTGVGMSDSVSFRLIVFADGVAPVVAPFSPETVSADIGAAFTGPRPTFSVDGVPTPTWSFTVDPAAAGMDIGLLTGVATWSPTEYGLYTITVKAENSFGDSSQSYTLRVSKPTRAGNWMLYE